MHYFYLPKPIVILILLFVMQPVFSQVVINEVFVSPSAGSGSTTNSNSLYNSDPAEQPPVNREWIELYNTSTCDTIDLGCYTLANNMEPPTGGGYSNWGAFTFPAGTLIYPASFLVVGGNAAPVPVLNFNLNYYRTNFFGIQYLDGDPTRWFLRDQYGWIALYSPIGAVQDAVYWDLDGYPGNLTVQEEYAHPVQTTTSCSGTMTLAAANSIPGIEYAGMVISGVDYSLQRTSDGAGAWYATSTTPTPGSCNSGCVGPPILNCTVIQETCLGGDGSITLTITTGNSGPYQIQWLHPALGNQPVLNNLSAGTYIVQVTDATGCYVVYDTVELLKLSGPDLSNNSVTNESCTSGNGAIHLNTTGPNTPFTYHWNSTGLNTPDLTNLNAGIYSVTVTDILGCKDSLTVHLTNQPGPEIEISGFTHELCSASNGGITTTTTGGTTPLLYCWNGDPLMNTPDLQGVHGGYYSVVVTDANGCSSNASATITNTPPPVLSFRNVTDETCHKANGSAILHIEGGHPPYTFQWIEFPASTDTLLDQVGEGTYHVMVTDSNCIVKDSVHINNIPGPIAAFRVYPLATTIETPRIVFYDETIGATSWNWDFGDWCNSDVPSPVHEYRDTGAFKVRLMIHDDQQCMDSVSHTVYILDRITLFIPNAFTPNADGLNDEFLAFGQNITDFECFIYNRWGEEVFHSTDIQSGWNGFNNQQPAPEGVYSWILWYKEDYRLYQMDRKVLKGHLTLFR